MEKKNSVQRISKVWSSNKIGGRIINALLRLASKSISDTSEKLLLDDFFSQSLMSK